MPRLTRPLARGQIYLEPRSLLAAAPARWRARGTLVGAFERAFAGALDAPHALALPHARVAFQLLLRALALPPGSEVLLTPVTIPEIVSVVLIEGLTPVFVDLAERTGNLDCDDLARKITPRSRVLLVTHLCGVASDMTRVLSLTRDRGIEVLEDCSQVPGTRHAGRALGLFGRAGFFSLTPLKPVSALFGGLTVTADDTLARELGRLAASLPPPLPSRRLLGLLARDVVLHAVTAPAGFATVGYPAVRLGEAWCPQRVRDFQRGQLLGPRGVTRLRAMPDWRYARFGEIQAAVGLQGLAALDEGNARRQTLALDLYDRLARAEVPGLLRGFSRDEATFWRFPLWTRHVRALRRHLRARGVDTSPTNLDCCSREPAFAPHLRDTPQARSFVDEMVFLPMHPTLTPSDVAHIADAVTDFYAGRAPPEGDARGAAGSPPP